SAARLLAQISGGVPRTINVICDHAAAIAADHETRRVNRRFIGQVAEQLGLTVPTPFERLGFRAKMGLAVTTAAVLVAALFIGLTLRSARPRVADSGATISQSTPTSSSGPKGSGDIAAAPGSAASSPPPASPPVADRLEAADSFLVTVA